MPLNKLKKVVYWANIILPPLLLGFVVLFFIGGFGVLEYYVLALAILYSTIFIVLLRKKVYTNFLIDIAAFSPIVLMLFVFVVLFLALNDFLSFSEQFLNIIIGPIWILPPIFLIAGLFTAMFKAGNLKLLSVFVLFVLIIIFFFPKKSGETLGFFPAKSLEFYSVEADCFGLRAESYPSGCLDCSSTIYCLGIVASKRNCWDSFGEEYGENRSQIMCPDSDRRVQDLLNG